MPAEAGACYRHQAGSPLAGDREGSGRHPYHLEKRVFTADTTPQIEFMRYIGKNGLGN